MWLLARNGLSSGIAVCLMIQKCDSALVIGCCTEISKDGAINVSNNSRMKEARITGGA